MKQLTIAFLKIFFRNRRAMFFVIFLPAAIFLAAALLGLEEIIQFELAKSRYTDFLLAGMIAYAVMQTGIYTIAYNLVDYRSRGILKQLFITPLPPRQFLLAQGLARFLVAIIQTGMLLLLGVIFFATHLQVDLLLLPVIILIGGTVFLNLGFLVAALARDYEEAAPYTAVLGIVLTFLGDVFFPVANLPPLLERIAHYLPLAPLAALLRFSLLGQSSETIATDAGVLLVWLIASSFAAGMVFNKSASK